LRRVACLRRVGCRSIRVVTRVRRHVQGGWKGRDDGGGAAGRSAGGPRLLTSRRSARRALRRFRNGSRRARRVRRTRALSDLAPAPDGSQSHTHRSGRDRPADQCRGGRRRRGLDARHDALDMTTQTPIRHWAVGPKPPRGSPRLPADVAVRRASSRGACEARGR
jgi:hypothetical protein